VSALQGDLTRASGISAVGRTGTERTVKLAFVAQVLVGTALGLAYLAAVGLSLDRVVLILAAAAAALAFVWPAAGLAVIALILPMREPDVLQPVYTIAVILSATGLGCLVRLPGDKRPLHIHPGIVLAAGYLIYSTLSIVPAISGHPPEWASSAALEVLRLWSGLAICIVASFLFRWMSPIPIVAVAILGSFLAAILALIAFWNIGPAGAIGGLLSPLRPDRAGGGFSNANYLGFCMAQATLLTLGCWFVVKKRYRPLLAIALVALVAALIVTFSRSSYIAVIVGVVVLAFLRSPRAGVLLMIVAVTAAVVLYPAFLDARLGGGDVFDPSVIAARAQSENWRRLAAAASVSMFLAQPLFGVGYGVFQHLSPAYIGASPATYSHNAYAQILAEQGLVGVLMVAAIVAVLTVALVRSAHPLRGAALAMGSAYLIQSFFINSTTSIQISGLLCLTLAAALSPIDRLQAVRKQEN
jgi:O-antigen ligase